MSHNEVLRFYSIDKSSDFSPFCIAALADPALADPVSSTGECEYPLDNTCHQNEECYLPPHTHRRVGTCRCKAGYHRDSTNTCVASDSIGTGKLSLTLKIKCNISFKFSFLYLLQTKLRNFVHTFWKDFIKKAQKD